MILCNDVDVKTVGLCKKADISIIDLKNRLWDVLGVNAQEVVNSTCSRVVDHVGCEPTYSSVAVPNPSSFEFPKRPIRKILEKYSMFVVRN